MDKPGGYRLVLGSCADVMEISVRLRGKRIERPDLMTGGCGAMAACGDFLTKAARVGSPAEAAAIEAEDVVIALDGCPAEHVHGATLAAGTLHQVIDDCCPGVGDWASR